MTDHDLRRPMDDVRSFLAQIDNGVDPVPRETGRLTGARRRSHPQSGDHADGIGAAVEHLPYNAGTLAASRGTRRGPVRYGRGDSSKGMQPEQLRKLTRKWAVPIIVVTILGAAASYLISKRLTPIYAATGNVLVIAGPGEAVGSGTADAGEATATAATQLTQPTLLDQVISTLHLNTTLDKLSKEVSAVAETNTELVDVTVSDPSATRAAQIANALMSAYVTHADKLNALRTAQGGAGIQANINTVQATINAEQQQLAAAKPGQDTTALRSTIAADQAQLSQLSSELGTYDATQAETLGAQSVDQLAPIPDKPSSPDTLLNTVAGGLAALVIAVGFAYLREFLDQGLKSAEDVRDRLGLPCLGVIPKFRHLPVRGKSFVPNHRHDEAVREAYRRLRINLLFATPDEELKTVVITSVRASEGKTCTAANLAVALAGSDRRVLLIDADLRKPDQHRLFETSLEGGLSELILKRPTQAQVPLNGLRPTQFANLSLLTSGTVPANPAELLASKRGMAVLKAIGPEQDLIVIDTAPAGLVTDPLSVAAGASATILVVEAGKTKASQAAGTIDSLREVGANVIGVVLNKASRRTGTGYYYQYGHSRYGQDHSQNNAASADDLLPPQADRASSNGHAPTPEPTRLPGTATPFR
jgi:non-specific protein-tyrosine kinase